MLKLYSPIKAEAGTVTTNKELQKLKKELFKVKEENEILKIHNHLTSNIIYNVDVDF